MLEVRLLREGLDRIHVALTFQLVILDVAVSRFRLVWLNTDGDETVRIIRFFEALTNLRFKGIFVRDQVVSWGNEKVCFGITLFNLERSISNTGCCITTKWFK